MNNARPWDIAKTIIKVLVTLGALYWVSTKIDLAEFKQTLFKSDPFFFYLP